MKSEQISKFLQARIDATDFPSAVYLVAEKGEIVFQDALGFAVVEPERIKARTDTIYDLASLTKPLVTGLLCAKLIENGKINLTDKIAKFFSEFGTIEKGEITIENLLTHTSGLAAWKPFYMILESEFQILDLVAREPLANAANSKIVYGDLNFIILGFLLEKVYAESLDKIVQKEICAPLKLEKTCHNPPPQIKKQIAANEKGNGFENNLAEEIGIVRDESQIANRPSAIRNYAAWGEVHDGNARFMNGVSGHAGVFSTAAETFKIAKQFLAEETVLLKPETCKLFRTNFTKRLNEARSVAFQLAETTDSTASESLSKDSFGHLGFTGTSLWIEPERKRIFILLTNRTHARQLPFVNINPTRRKFHELAAEALSEK